MISFKQFILTENDDRDLDTFIDTIKRECSEFLRYNKVDINRGGALFRGIDGSDDTGNLMGPIEPRRNRRPMSTPQNRHLLMDDWFKDKFGFRYRSNGLFCFPNWDDANSYSRKVFLIFPANGYELCASNSILDLFTEFNDASEDPSDHALEWFQDEYYKDAPSKEEAIELFRQYERENDKGFIKGILENGDYFETKQLDDINKESEVMVQCSEYYAIRTNGYFFGSQDILDRLNS